MRRRPPRRAAPRPGGGAISASTRWIVGLIVAVAALAAVAVAVSSGVRAPAELTPGSPEASVQRYLAAVADGDVEALRATLHDERADDCSEDALRRATERGEDLEVSVTLRGVERDGDEAEVTVRITEYHGEPPLDGGGYEHTETFRLERDDGRWGIVDPGWPYLGCLRS